jgi:hypothetical protein
MIIVILVWKKEWLAFKIKNKCIILSEDADRENLSHWTWILPASMFEVLSCSKLHKAHAV